MLPSPRGRRCPEGADEGHGVAIGLPPEDEAHAGSGDPHPADPATFSRGEKELSGTHRPLLPGLSSHP